MTRTHEEKRAVLLREREERKAAYLGAIAERDALAPFAQGPDALEFDRRALARAESRVNSALQRMKDWKDPLPAAPAAATVTAPAALTAPVQCAPVGVSQVDDEVEATARRILECASAAAGGPAADPEVEAIAQRILASARLASDEEAADWAVA